MNDTLPLSVSSEPIEGWRVWSLCANMDGSVVQLRSLIGSIVWEPEGIAAESSHRCRTRNQTGWQVFPWEHDPPVPKIGCSCGLWAVQTREMVWKVLTRYGQWPPYGMAYGRVALSGTVLKTEIGYRAQKGKVLEVWMVPGERQSYSMTVDSVMAVFKAHALDKSPYDYSPFTIPADRMGDRLRRTYEVPVHVTLERELGEAYVHARRKRRERLSAFASPAMSGYAALAHAMAAKKSYANSTAKTNQIVKP